MSKPWSEACERNREPILSVLMPLLIEARTVLEIGSGTGQHAVHFAYHMPHLTWYSSDRLENLAGIRLWVEDAALENAPEPFHLDVNQPGWPVQQPDAVFSANTCHIMNWSEVEAMINTAARQLAGNGLLLLYGPFNRNGNYTSPSNEQFDMMLRARDPLSGIRDLEAIDALARAGGLELQDDVAMPANNQLVYWKKNSKGSG